MQESNTHKLHRRATTPHPQRQQRGDLPKAGAELLEQWRHLNHKRVRVTQALLAEVV